MAAQLSRAAPREQENRGRVVGGRRIRSTIKIRISSATIDDGVANEFNAEVGDAFGVPTFLEREDA